MPAAAASPDQPAPKAPQAKPAPAPEPTTQPARAKLGELLAQRWRWYKTAWAGNDMVAQSNSDNALVDTILKAKPEEVATLRDEMEAEYKRLASLAKPDDFQLGRLAARIVVAWTRYPTGQDVSSPQLGVYRALSCRQIAHWGAIALKHLGGDIPKQTLSKYGSFIPGTAASVMSLMQRALPIIDSPAEVRKQVGPVADKLRGLSEYSDAKTAHPLKTMDLFFDALTLAADQQADKDAVAKLVAAFPKAYNARDTKAFAALWPAGHAKVANIRDQQLADVIPADLWTITHWQCAYIVVQKDLAEAYVVTQYTAKEGTAGGFNLQGFPARKDPKEGWKLN